MLGDAEKAIDLLEVCVGQVAHDMKMWFRNDPDFNGIKDHPRFRALIESVNWSNCDRAQEPDPDKSGIFAAPSS